MLLQSWESPPLPVLTPEAPLSPGAPFFPWLSLTSIVGCQGLQHLASTPTDLRLRVAQHVHEQVQGAGLPEDPGEGSDAGIGAEHVGFSRDVRGIVSYGFRPLKLRLNSCGTRAELLQGMCCPHRSRIEPMSPKLTDRFFTPEPPGERPGQHFKISK